MLCWISVTFNSAGDLYNVTVFLLHWNINIWGLSWKNFENSRTTLLIYNLFGLTALGLFSERSRAATIIRPSDMHVANDDLSVSSHNSIEIRSHNIVFCRLGIDNCVHFLLGSRLVSLCRPVMIVKKRRFLINELAQTVSLITATT